MTTLLSGLRVVESSAFVAVPLAGLTLAQMGAEVIRIDRPQGGLDAGRWPLAPTGESLFWAGLNKGKKSVSVDSRTPRGRELITQIITAAGSDAGVFMTNLAAPGHTDHATLSQHRSDMITATLAGDRHGRPAVDYTVNPSLGVPNITGHPDDPRPVAHAIPAWDLLAGQLMVNSVLAAERHRLRTGRGQAVDLSLKDVAAAMVGHLGLLADAALGSEDRSKSGNSLYGAYGQDFDCACGGRVMVIGLTKRQWNLLVKVTGTGQKMADLAQRLGEDLADEGMRWRYRNQITAILQPWFITRRIDEFAQDFDTAGLTWSRFRTLKDALRHDPDLGPQNPMFAEHRDASGKWYPVPGLPTNFSDAARTRPGVAPRLGAHTEEVLADVVGLSSGEIARLFDQSVIGQPCSLSRDAA